MTIIFMNSISSPIVLENLYRKAEVMSQTFKHTFQRGILLELLVIMGNTILCNSRNLFLKIKKLEKL